MRLTQECAMTRIPVKFMFVIFIVELLKVIIEVFNGDKRSFDHSVGIQSTNE